VATGTLVHELHFWFSTKYLDEETGLYYYGYRYYSPRIGRWLSRDPIEEEGGVALYNLCWNNPVISCDACGLKIIKIVLGDSYSDPRNGNSFFDFEGGISSKDFIVYATAGANLSQLSAQIDALKHSSPASQSCEGNYYYIIYNGGINAAQSDATKYDSYDQSLHAIENGETIYTHRSWIANYINDLVGRGIASGGRLVSISIPRVRFTKKGPINSEQHAKDVNAMSLTMNLGGYYQNPVSGGVEFKLMDITCWEANAEDGLHLDTTQRSFLGRLIQADFAEFKQSHYMDE